MAQFTYNPNTGSFCMIPSDVARVRQIAGGQLQTVSAPVQVYPNSAAFGALPPGSQGGTGAPVPPISPNTGYIQPPYLDYARPGATQKQAYDVADQIQGIVAKAMSLTQTTSNNNAKALAQKAYKLAFETVTLATNGQYDQAVQRGASASQTAQQALSLIGK